MEITISIPEKQFLSDLPEGTAEKIKRYAALGMYQAGELSIGAASELAGLDLYAFLELCKKEGIALHTQTPDDLEADFNKLISEM